MAIVIALANSPSAFAVSFNIGEVDGSLDSSLSVGASFSTADRNKNLIGVNNGGKGLAQAGDDGRLNFDKGEAFSKIFKGVHDLELKYQDFGVFVRGKYWYDFELKDEHQDFKDIDDHGRKEGAKSSGGQILDAFIYKSYSIGNQAGSARFGKQVVNWGESTFLQGGISTINPIDVASLRRPGSEVKEGLIPVNMFYISQNISENLTAEAFYQLEWDQTVVDNCGTFFAGSDTSQDGCTKNLAALTNNPVAIASLNSVLAPAGLGVESSPWNEGIVVKRGPDRDARDSGQFGFATRYFFEPLDTEFGAYFINYHSRLPVFGATAPSAAIVNRTNNLATGVARVNPGLATQVAAAALAGNSQYFMEYPEDIHLYGLSFSTTLSDGTAWSGELSYRPNAPVQLATTDINYAVLGLVNVGGVRPYQNADVMNIGAGQDLHGYNRKEITQLQTTFTHFFEQVMGASRLTLVGEAGWTHVGGLESNSDTRYGRDPVFGPGPFPGTIGGLPTCAALNAATLGSSSASNVSRNCKNDGFTTPDSWGYRARAIWDYNDVFSSVNLKPSIAWSHDVKGYSPSPGGNFEEGRKAISLGLDADYLNTYTASLSYTNYFDGKYSTVNDRDFLALSFGMTF
ncbi:DUF1302 domain-containing protein [Pseudomonas yamanorum]|uniref:DUF1302 domain-containing protein n=1 Tax=Pseudomonas yamanorum TaxID=515393 RepID=UPI0035270FAC